MISRQRREDQVGNGLGTRDNRSRRLQFAGPADRPDQCRRIKAARCGLAFGDINTTVQTAIGGQAAGDL